MGMRAKGRFEVSVKPDPPHEVVDGVALARAHVTKQFHGDLEGTSTVEMLTVGSAETGSAAYVALERVQGTLQGRTGSFVLRHMGLRGRGTQSLQISVVPDSGTGSLRGIGGRMEIEIVDGQHSYDFEYELAAV